MNLLYVDSLNKSYGNKKLLSDIFLSTKVGEITGLLGRNGSGKSTLLKIIFGCETADFKFVKTDDRIIKNVFHAKDIINYLPQENFLPSNIKTKYIIDLFLPKGNRSIILDNDYIKPLLEKKNHELSGGEKRILEILLIVNSNARFILLDEPFNGVSPIIRDYIVNYLKKTKKDKGYIITDHYYEEVIELSDKIFHLKNGHLKELKENTELIDLGYISQKSYDAILNK